MKLTLITEQSYCFLELEFLVESEWLKQKKKVQNVWKPYLLVWLFLHNWLAKGYILIVLWFYFFAPLFLVVDIVLHPLSTAIGIWLYFITNISNIFSIQVPYSQLQILVTEKEKIAKKFAVN